MKLFNAKFFHPKIHYYDQDFVDLYGMYWSRIKKFIINPKNQDFFQKKFINSQKQSFIYQSDCIFNTFYLVYLSSNLVYPTGSLDYFYKQQDKEGAIANCYNFHTDEVVYTKDNPLGIGPPLFSWAEYNIYQKVGNQKRLNYIFNILNQYYEWIRNNFRSETGLYHAPISVNWPFTQEMRPGTTYSIDFNAQQAINVLYMAHISDLLGQKKYSFLYKKEYFTLKTLINDLMWNEHTQFYYDLDENKEKIKIQTLASFWVLLAQIPNRDRVSLFIKHLEDKTMFFTEYPFPLMSQKETEYSSSQYPILHTVHPIYNFMVIKGLSVYEEFSLAKEISLIQLYHINDVFFLNHNREQNTYFYYLYSIHNHEKPNLIEQDQCNVFLNGLSIVTLMIENVIGIYVSLPKKIVDWITPTIEAMGIENLFLRKNKISIIIVKNEQHWEIRMSSEKLYYFTLKIQGHHSKTLPIPSGQCSILLDKILSEI